MITLITGTPGSGKSLYTVAELLRKAYAGRRLLVAGIPDLLLDHELLSYDQAADWHTICQPEDVLVVDEAQKIWRPRGTGAATPAGVAALEIHRQTYSIDVVIITQHPGLIDSNIRKLVGRHIHLRNLWGMKRALVYEWAEATDPNRIKTAMVKPWAYPRDAYRLYKSADVHTKRGQRPPIIAWLTIAMFAALPFAGWAAWQSFHKKPVVVEPHQPAAQTLPVASHETAPVAPISVPVYPPAVVIAGCYRGVGRCTCLDGRGNQAEVTDQFCAEWMAGQHHDMAPMDAKPYDGFAHVQPVQQAPISREGIGVSPAFSGTDAVASLADRRPVSATSVPATASQVAPQSFSGVQKP